MRSAFNKISAGLEDALAFASGDTSRGRAVESIDVNTTHRATKLTQDQFART